MPSSCAPCSCRPASSAWLPPSRWGQWASLSTSFTDDVGWTGVIVAWLAQLNTGIIFVVSALISMLQHGSTVAAATFAQVDSSFADMLQGPSCSWCWPLISSSAFKLFVHRRGAVSMEMDKLGVVTTFIHNIVVYNIPCSMAR